MEITFYGYVLIPLLVVLSIVKPKYLIYFLIISLTLQVTSLFNIGNYSMQVYRFITILLSVRFMIYILRKGMLIKLRDKSLKGILIIGTLFALFTNMWSYSAPFIFSGYPVFPPELGIDFSAVYGPSPLHFSPYNIAYSGYIFLYLLTLMYISILNWTEKDIIIIKRVIVICLFIVVLTSISQVVSYIFGTLDITKYVYTITTREFGYSLIGDLLPIPRIQATYQEPSMLAPFLVGLYSSYFYRTLTKFNYLNLFLIILICLLVILSTSTTAYLSLLIMTFILILYLKPVKISKFSIKIRRKLVLQLFTVLLLLVLLVVITVCLIIGLDKFIYLVDSYIVKKSETVSFINRTTADLHALNLFFNTYGLGVGLGSNRPSSLLPYLLSQVGIIGTLLFIIFIGKISAYFYKALKNTNYFEFFFFVPSVLISQLIVYPDITNPTLWQFIYVALITSLGVKNETLH
ncbi:MAG: hypothetical protein QW726_06265 [Fervidicoccaceae archaeon]